MLKKELEALVAEQAEAIESLRAQLHAANERSAEETAKRIPESKVFDRIKQFTNASGVGYNCRLVEDFDPEELSDVVAARAIGKSINRRRSPFRKDRHGRTWVDIYGADTGGRQMEEAA